MLRHREEKPVLGRPPAEVTDAAQGVPVREAEQAVRSRRDLPAWLRAREEVAVIVGDVLRQRRGALTRWAARLGGISHAIVSRWIAPDQDTTPTVADVLVMEREDAIRVVRALHDRLVAPEQRDPHADAHTAVALAANLLAEVERDYADGRLDRDERVRLATLGERFVDLGERLVALRGKR